MIFNGPAVKQISKHQTNDSRLNADLSASHEALGAKAVLLGSAFLVSHCSIVLTASVFFAFGLSISLAVLGIAMAMTGLWCHILTRENRQCLKPFTLFASVLAGYGIAIAMSAWCYDISWDGQAYHAEAVLRLASGWNPFHRELPDSVLYDEILNHFPRAAWISAACVYNVTGILETGKAFNFIVLATCFTLALGTTILVLQLDLPKAVTVSLLLTFNPVNISQLFTFYVDGQVGALMTALVCLFLLYPVIPRPVIPITLVACIAIVSNVKVTGLIYCLLLSAGLFVRLLTKSEVRVKALAPYFLLAFFLAAGLVGFNPYVTNFIRYHNPFYPAIGPEQGSSWIRDSTPDTFFERNRLEKLCRSLYSESSNERNKPAQLKLPFACSNSEIHCFNDPDTRIGGFGPLFGAALLLSFAIPVITWRTRRKDTIQAILLLLLVLVTVLVNPECWWARYVPQLWAVPVILVALGMAGSPLSGRVSALLVALILAVNSCLIGYVATTFCYRQTEDLRTQLQDLSDRGVLFDADLGPFPSNRARLKETGLQFRERTLRCEDPIEVRRLMLRLCPAKE